ncbi:MAG: hypothetical protein DRP58_10145 [Spirochaetes bacterium]|nr:MAG: hypothetical protein DRP58_10145 [Spirochaetota bacterium]
MEKRHDLSILLIVHFLLVVSIPLFSETIPIVQVDPVVNLSDEVWLDAVCDAATDNVLFTLKFLGQFEVLSDDILENETERLINAEPIDQENFDTSSLKTRAESEGYDNILFGSCTIEDGSYVIKMNAYDLALDKITYSGSTVVDSIFDTFEAVDEITYQTVEGFSGIHVTYGSLVLVPPGTGEPFSFTIDGIALPEGIFSVERMPAGVHELAVRQERPFGLYEFVHEIIVEEESENRIDIPLPNIVGEEIPIFNQADEYLAFSSIKENAVVADNLDEINGLLETPFFQEFRVELVQKYKTWVSLVESELDFSNDKESFSVSQYIESIWNFATQQRVFNDIVSLSSQYPILLLDQEQLKEKNIFIPEIKKITIDGRSNDWNDVASVFRDGTDDVSSLYEQGEGQDIAWIGITADENRIYFAIETVSKIYRKDRFYLVHIISKDLLDLRYDGRDDMFRMTLVQNGDWNKNKWYDTSDSSLRGQINEILEMSFPIDKIEEMIQPLVGTVKLDFIIQRSSDPYYHMDLFSVRCVLPSIYYAFRAEEL